MQLTRCNPPSGPLEPAPSSSLREAAAGERWEGFWCADDERHYTRRTRANGAVEWYRIAEAEEPRRFRARRKAATILPFPARATSSRMMVGRYRGQAMIVGTSRRGGEPRESR